MVPTAQPGLVAGTIRAMLSKLDRRPDPYMPIAW